MSLWIRRLAPLTLLALLSACGGTNTAWNGRRGYDGNGDYGYDLNASRAEAHQYRLQAARNYPAPGTPDDPWGPYIRQAAAHYSIPERWIRAVMHQESGGQLVGADGSLTTSNVGAMGLMQVMPATYDMLRQREGLGDDPYEPHDNIMAGASYIREMYDRFGAPGFLAAYNAGPDRLDAYLAGGAVLPDETVNYLAQVAPNLGSQTAMTGPLAIFAGSGVAVAALPQTPGSLNPDAAYAGGGMVVASDDPSDRAFDGGGLVTATAPTGDLTGRAPAPEPPRPVVVAYDTPHQAGSFLGARMSASVAPASYALAPSPGPEGGWGIQVGAFPDAATSRAAAAAAQSRAAGLLAGTRPQIVPVQHGGLLYRARLTGLSADAATLACTALSRGGTPCFTVAPGL